MPDYLSITIAASIALLSLVAAGSLHTLCDAIATHRQAQALSILHHAGMLDDDED